MFRIELIEFEFKVNLFHNSSQLTTFGVLYSTIPACFYRLTPIYVGLTRYFQSDSEITRDFDRLVNLYFVLLTLSSYVCIHGFASWEWTNCWGKDCNSQTKRMGAGIAVRGRMCSLACCLSTCVSIEILL